MESDSDLTPYELRVKRNIEENQRVLKSLGLLNPTFGQKNIKKTTRRSNVAVKGRGSFRPNESPAPSLPARRTRRSSSILKAQGYDEFDDIPIEIDEENTPPHKKKKVAPEPVFGSISGVSVGDWWATRIECSAAGVHRPTVAGIHGKLEEGCYSIALSGGYEDDIDYGEYFTYTGSGGRDLKGTKTNPKNLRTAPQTKDQVLEGPNAALALNIENLRPVRVIRGYKLPSPYAPEEGYRYDGLYSVLRCWTAVGLSGFKVYKYALKRLQDQDPQPWITNGLDVSAQNGHGPPATENNPDEDRSLQNTTSELADQPVGLDTSSSTSILNHNQDVTKDNEGPKTNNDVKKSLKRSLSGSNIHNSEENGKKLKSSELSLNSSQKDKEEHIQPAPDKINTSTDTTIEPESTVQDTKYTSDPLNSIENVSEKDIIEKPVKIVPNKKGSRLDSEVNKEELKSSEDLLTISQDKNSIETHVQIVPNKKRISSSSGLDTEMNEDKGSSADPLNVEGNKGELKSSEDLLTVSRDKNSIETHVQIVPNKKRISSSSWLDTEKNEDKESSADLLNVEGNKDMIVKQIIQVTPKRRTSSNLQLESKEIEPETLNDINSLDTVQNTLKYNNKIEKKTQPTLKRNLRRSSSLNSLKETTLESKSTGSPKCIQSEINNGTNESEMTYCNEQIENEPRQSTYQYPLQPTFLSKEEISDFKSTHKSTQSDKSNSVEKKVRFSPDVVLDVDGKKYVRPISSPDSGNKSCAVKLDYSSEICDYPQESHQNVLQNCTNNSNEESKKQTSILKYFEPIKKVDEKRVVSRGILLRSNRRSLVSNNLTSVAEASSASNDMVPVKSCSTSPDENKSLKKVSPTIKLAESKSATRSKRKRSSLESTEVEVVEIANKKVQKHESLLLKECYVIIGKPCVVQLIRLDHTRYRSVEDSRNNDILEDYFLGWDWDNELIEFLGFDCGDDGLLFCGFDDLHTLNNLQLLMSVMENKSCDL